MAAAHGDLTAEADPLAPYRGKLIGLAYRMLGTRTEAEDVLQDAYLRLAGTDRSKIENEEAFLTTVVTRLCLDRLRSARAKREVYVGPWLPEPVLDAEALSPEASAELADDLSFALLLTLERLSAPERAAFLLHDVFDLSFAEIAAMLEKSEAACRQLATRARKALKEERPARPSSDDEHRTLLYAFGAAAAEGDIRALAAMLAEGAIAYTDGGGIKTAARNPIYGPDRIARFFAGLARKVEREHASADFREVSINGRPGLLLYFEGDLDQAVTIDVTEGRIRALYVVRNPDKLGHIARLVGTSLESGGHA